MLDLQDQHVHKYITMTEIKNVNVRSFTQFMFQENQSSRYPMSLIWTDLDYDYEGVNTVGNIFLHPSEGLDLPMDLAEVNELYLAWLDTQD